MNMIRTINDILKSSEGINKEVDKVLTSNCRMLLSVGFCKEESYLKAIKTAHRLGLDKKEKVKVIDFV